MTIFSFFLIIILVVFSVIATLLIFLLIGVVGLMLGLKGKQVTYSVEFIFNHIIAYSNVRKLFNRSIIK